jgi:transposase
MARTASGKDVIEKAKEYLSKAKTAEELRQAQTVILPLEYGFSIEQTAAITGISVRWASHLRIEFIRSDGSPKKSPKGGRRRENLTPAEEANFLAPFFEKAKEGGILIVSEIKEALDARVGRKVSLASVYNLLHRHNWRKLAPDKRHPKSDVATQDEWKKNCPSSSPKLTGSGQTNDQSG